jgi:serine/threonine-protein kinase RsbW
VDDRSLSLILDSRLDELPRLTQAIEDFCGNVGAADLAPDFMLCAEELVSNVILHGFAEGPGHAIEVDIACAPAGISVEIRDDAPAFDPTTPIFPDLDAPIEDRAIGGLGRHLVSTLMDCFCYRRHTGRNYVSFGRAVAGQGEL